MPNPRQNDASPVGAQVFPAGAQRRERHCRCYGDVVRAVRQFMDDVLPVLAFLLYLAVEGLLIYGLLKWAGAL